MMRPGTDMSEDEMAASFQAYLKARGGRIEPMWSNHSRAERTANLRHHHANRRSIKTARRLQAYAQAQPSWSGSSAQEKQSNLSIAVRPVTSICEDQLASNTGDPVPCTYNCEVLQAEYFPQPQNQTTRCFLFDPATSTWPETSGQHSELLSMRQQRFETHTYISSEAGMNPPPSGLSFTMGQGRQCRNVTMKALKQPALVIMGLL